jgi:iron(III) transport system permease protein
MVMTRWRVAVAVLLLGVVGAPLAAPFVRLGLDPAAWRVWGDSERLLGLARNTALLTAGVLALALPVGVAGAVLLYRTDLPFRRTLRFLTILTLFIPLPLFTSGWQAVLGSEGWLPLAWWNPPRPGAASATAPGGVWAPWGQGVGSAVWIDALACLPWVVLLVGHGLTWVERELEEDALTAAGPWRVLFGVTLWRARAAVAAAALWAALLTAGEITVTDVMQVRTFGEEVYTQFVAPEGGAASEAWGDMVGRGAAVAAPAALAVAALTAFMAARWQRRLPPRAAVLGPPLLYRLGRARWPLFALIAATAVALLAIPVGSLVWRLGLHGTPRTWSAPTAGAGLRAALRTEGPLIAESLLTAAAAGALAAALALATCWAALDAPWLRYGALALMALVWATPGPVVGLGLKNVILGLLEATGWPRGLRVLLWDGPSFIPLLWVDVVRFFPFAAAVLWPAVRLTPRELRDAARADGAGPVGEFLGVAVPLHARSVLRAAAAVAVLSLAELSAGKLVSTPGFDSFAEMVFAQMHYGVRPELAASCLILLATVVCVAVLAALPAGGRGARRPDSSL